MTNDEVVRQLFAACQSAGVDPDTVLSHFNEQDIDAYGQALAEGWIPAAVLPKWMRSTAETIASGRCLCRKCSGESS